jgi:flavin reductase (DIM6/NTAB) family NADH-FMN oxidoreductase RutF
VKFSKPATKEGMTLNDRPIREGQTGAPIFEEAVAYLECEVRHAYDVGTHTLFLGEVVAAEIRDDEAEIASMTDTRMKYGGVKRH